MNIIKKILEDCLVLSLTFFYLNLKVVIEDCIQGQISDNILSNLACFVIAFIVSMLLFAGILAVNKKKKSNNSKINLVFNNNNPNNNNINNNHTDNSATHVVERINMIGKNNSIILNENYNFIYIPVNNTKENDEKRTK